MHGEGSSTATAWTAPTFEELQVVGDLLQDDKAGQNEAHRAPQPRVRLLAAAGSVALAVLCQAGPQSATRSDVKGVHAAVATGYNSTSNEAHTPKEGFRSHRISAIAQVEMRPQHASVLGVRPAGTRFVKGP